MSKFWKAPRAKTSSGRTYPPRIMNKCQIRPCRAASCPARLELIYPPAESSNGTERTSSYSFSKRRSRVARGNFTPRPSRIRTGGSRLIRLL